MGSKEKFASRADDLADALRRYLVGINTGGVTVSLTFSAGLAEQHIAPDWVVVPAALFIAGLGVSGGSMLYAKHKALKRRDAAELDTDVPKFDRLLQRNLTWETVTLVLFLAGCLIALIELSRLPV